MDPKQWRAEHRSIQGMPVLWICGTHAITQPKNTAKVWSAPVVRAYSEKSAKYPGEHRTTRNAPTGQMGERAKQSGDKEVC